MAMPGYRILQKRITTASSSQHVAIDLANILLQISTGRIRTSLTLHERDRVHSLSYSGAMLTFRFSAPVDFKDWIVLIFHRNIHDIILMGSGENGMASILDVLVSEPDCGNKFYKDSDGKHH